jgi:hypothetical protein
MLKIQQLYMRSSYRAHCLTLSVQGGCSRRVPFVPMDECAKYLGTLPLSTAGEERFQHALQELVKTCLCEEHREVERDRASLLAHFNFLLRHREDDDWGHWVCG